MSRSEVLLWVRLRERAAGKPSRLVVEVDGRVHEEEHRILRDHHRDEYLRERGCTVLRITVREGLNDPDAAAAKICAAARMPPRSRSA